MRFGSALIIVTFFALVFSGDGDLGRYRRRSKKDKDKHDEKYYVDLIVSNLTSIRSQIAPIGGLDGVLRALQRYQARNNEAAKTGRPDTDLNPVLRYLRKKASTLDYLKEVTGALGTVDSLLGQLRSFGGLLSLLGAFTAAGAGAASVGGGGVGGQGVVVTEPVSIEVAG